MKFKVQDQLDTFAFRDVEVVSCELTEDALRMTMRGVISKYNNPCNERFQDWYILEAYARFEGAKITNCYKEGMKYYDANNVLLEEVPDEPIVPDAYADTIKLFQNSCMFMLIQKESQADDQKSVEVAFDLEEGNDTYWVEFAYDRVIIEWDRYANKVIES
ncbi:MAG: hypothetical protein ACI4TK_11160 [Agathobacter sp.]